MDRAVPFVSHLEELRRRIIYALVAVIVGVGVGWAWVPSLYRWIMSRAPMPLTQVGITEVFLLQFHLGIWAGIILASPVVLYQAIAFVMPALRPGERRLLWGLLPAALGLFLCGFTFAYTFVVPAATRFFLSVARDSGAQIIMSPTHWLDINLNFSLPLGAVFELPVLVWILASIGLVSSYRLKKWRKFSVLGALVVGALISPAPVVVDQMIMAIPMLLLYEISIWVTAMVEKRRHKQASA